MSSMNFYSCNEDMAKLFFFLWNKTMILDGVASTSQVSAMSYLVNQYSPSLKNIAGHSCMVRLRV